MVSTSPLLTLLKQDFIFTVQRFSFNSRYPIVVVHAVYNLYIITIKKNSCIFTSTLFYKDVCCA